MAEKEKQLSVMEEVNGLVNNALKALDEFSTFDQEKIDYIVAKCSVAGLDHHGTLAKAAIDETKRGIFEDKATKNLFACEYVVNNMRHLKTAGIIYRQSGQWLLKDPYCRWELHKTRTANYTRSDGQPASNLYTVWTERGRRFITALHAAQYDPRQAPRLLRDLLSPPAADAELSPSSDTTTDTQKAPTEA